MQTPPNVNPRTIFLNYREGARGQPTNQADFIKNDIRMNPKLYQKKELFPTNQTEKQNVTKLITEMKKQLNYLQNTKWMFQNNEGVLPIDNFSFINL